MRDWILVLKEFLNFFQQNSAILTVSSYCSHISPVKAETQPTIVALFRNQDN